MADHQQTTPFPTIDLLGVPLSQTTTAQFLAWFAAAVVGEKQSTVYTPNAEMIVDAQFDGIFADVLSDGDVLICDGKGPQLFASEPIERISGSSIIVDMCLEAEKTKAPVFFLGSGSNDVLEKLQAKLTKDFPQLVIAGVDPGPQVQQVETDGGKTLLIDADEQRQVLETIRQAAPAVLFVAFGHGKQEKWIHQYLSELPSVRVAMAVGGAFDFLSGTVRRAPRLFRQVGLEWLWRLVHQPWRITRILKAVIGFPFIYLYKKIT